MTPSTTTPLLSADRPRLNPEEDLLGYAPFARLLAHSALRGSPAAGLVVGIYGEWGLGKTTLLNFIEHFTVADTGDDPPIIVRFNPWWFSGREDLLRRFFKELEGAVLKSRARNAKLRDALQKLGDAMGNAPSAWVAGAGKFMAAAAKLGQPADVVGLKAALAEALAAEELRVIVLIDDIDRLLPSEMVDIFRLVRSVGDLPNVHYVLAFDRAVVASALTTDGNLGGERYLEKIIQAPFELPRPDPGALHRMFTKQLDTVLSGTHEDLLGRRYWSAVFLNGIAPFLRTPRDVTRLINALAVTYPAVRNEVNPTDFVAVETLRLFAPAAYDTLRSNRDRFVGHLAALDHLQKETRTFHEGWLNRLGEHAEAVRSLLGRLFPHIGAALSLGSTPAVGDAGLRRARRICTEQVFDAYFRYSLDGDLSRMAFLACLDAGRDRLVSMLDAFSKERLPDGSTRLRRFLDMLHDEAGNERRINEAELVVQLCRLGDTLLPGSEGTFSFQVGDDDLHAAVVQKLLERVPVGERAPILMTALASSGVSTVTRIVTLLAAEHGRHGEEPIAPAQRTIASGDDVVTLEELALRRIEEAAAAGALWSTPRLVPLLFHWRRLGGGAGSREAVTSWALAAQENLLRLLSGVARYSSDGLVAIDVPAISELADVERLVDLAQEVLHQGLVDRKARNLLQGLVTGHPEYPGARATRSPADQILLGILHRVRDTDAYPEAHAIRVTHEAHRDAIDGLIKRRLVGFVNNTGYMVQLAGLQAMRADPFAAGELAVCADVLRRLQDAYRADSAATIDMETLSNVMRQSDAQVTTNAVKRAAIVLQRLATGRGSGLTIVSEENGMPRELNVQEGILDLSPEGIVAQPEPAVARAVRQRGP